MTIRMGAEPWAPEDRRWKAEWGQREDYWDVRGGVAWCRLCKKAGDEWHIASALHTRRVQSWRADPDGYREYLAPLIEDTPQPGEAAGGGGSTGATTSETGAAATAEPPPAPHPAPRTRAPHWQVPGVEAPYWGRYDNQGILKCLVCDREANDAHQDSYQHQKRIKTPYTYNPELAPSAEEIYGYKGTPLVRIPGIEAPAWAEYNADH